MDLVRSYFGTNESLPSWTFLSSLVFQIRADQCWSGNKSEEKSVQLVRGSFVPKWLLTKSIFKKKTLDSEPQIFNCFSRQLEQFFLKIGQKNLRNKILLFLFLCKKRRKILGKQLMINQWFFDESQPSIQPQNSVQFFVLFGFWWIVIFLFLSKRYRKKTCRNVLKWNFHTTITIA